MLQSELLVEAFRRGTAGIWAEKPNQQRFRRKHSREILRAKEALRITIFLMAVVLRQV